MFQNYFKIAFRNLYKHKAYSAINILGLALGLTCVILILLFVKDELSYDSYHADKDRIYRIIAQYVGKTQTQTFALGEHKRAPLIRTDIPELEEVTRIGNVGPTVQYGEKIIQENDFYIADPNIFKVFTLPLIKGNPETALKDPFTVVINETASKKYFGNEDPIGKTITILDTVQLIVTAVMKDMPRQSHFHADFICSMGTDRAIYSDIVFQNWGELSMYTYVLAPPAMTREELDERLAGFVKKHFSKEDANNIRYTAQPLTSIHLENYNAEMEVNGDRSNVIIFTAIALATLLIAGINYTNLSTARSSLRAKEVGIRKTVGAKRMDLIGQFLGETFLFSFIALTLAILFSEMLLPVFNSVADRSLSLLDVMDLKFVSSLLLIVTAIGLLAGLYPAFFLSAFQPIAVLKGAIAKGAKGGLLRKIFVTSQFAVSVGLIAATVVVYQQLQFLKNRPLGYSPEQIIVVEMPTDAIQQQYESIKESFLSLPGVQSVSKTSKRLGGRLSSNLGFKSENVPEGMTSMQAVVIDHDFFKTINVPVVEGRDFSNSFPSDAENAFIINETAMKTLGWESAVGKRFETNTLNEKGTWSPKKGQIIGVIKDFHYEPLYRKIVPVVFYISPYWSGRFVIKIDSHNMPETLDALQKVWKRFAANQPFDYEFLDQRIQGLYVAQERFGKLISYFAGLAIVIACLGLFGLASFTAEQRTKEIGIRKVMGASVSTIVFLLAKDFLKLVLLAIVLATPLAYWAMDRWLMEFAYKIEPGMVFFVLSGLLALLIAFLTVSYQALKAATANPVNALKYE